MHTIKHLLFLLLIPCFAFTSMHKYYVSVTQIDYVRNKKSVQITTRIFTDDFESVLRSRYNKNITLNTKQELESVNQYMERYLNEKIAIKINGKDVQWVFIGKEYDTDLVKCYLEIEGVKKIESFEIKNHVLFDMFEEQQNIIKTTINSKQKSVILSVQNDRFWVNYN